MNAPKREPLPEDNAIQLLSRWGELRDPNANDRRRWTTKLVLSYGGSEDLERIAALAGHSGPGIDEVLIEREREERIGEAIWAALETVTDKQREVLVLRYGLDCGGPRTLRTVGQLVGIAPKNVLNLERRAFDALRQNVTLRAVQKEWL